MIRTPLLSVFALLLLCGFTQSKRPSLRVSFGGITAGKAYLYDTRNFTTDTVAIRGGKLEYDKAVPSPTVYHLVIEGYNQWNRPLKLVLSAEATELKFDTFLPTRETGPITGLYPNQPTFISDPNHNGAYYKLQREWVSFFDAIQRLTPKEGEPDTSLETRKQRYVNFIQFSEATVTATSDKLVAGVIVEHLLNENLLPLEKVQQFYAAFSPEVKKNPYTAGIGVEAGFATGSPAPAFEFTDLKGKYFSRQEAKGRKVLLHFWSSTCAPCIKEAPQLLRLQEKYKNQNLVIINVSLDTDKSRWLKGISRAGIGEMINTCDFKSMDGKIVQNYRIKSIPAHYLIDENGKIICKGTIDEIVKRL